MLLLLEIGRAGWLRKLQDKQILLFIKIKFGSPTSTKGHSL